MATKKQSSFANGKEDIKEPIQVIPRCVTAAENGMNDSHDFMNLMKAITLDVVTGLVKPEMVNAACNSSGKMLKMWEMQLKYGRGKQPLQLTNRPTSGAK